MIILPGDGGHIMIEHLWCYRKVANSKRFETCVSNSRDQWSDESNERRKKCCQMWDEINCLLKISRQYCNGSDLEVFQLFGTSVRVFHD